MTRMRCVRTMACVLVVITLTVTLLGGSAAATSTNDLRKIVTFKNINLETILGYTTALAVVTATGSTVVHNLSFINALAITLPASNTTEALTSLLNNLYVLEVVDDLMSALVDPICPAPAPPSTPESYPWGEQRIDVPEVAKKWPLLKGLGVAVAIVDTGIDPTHLEYHNRIAQGYNAIFPGGPPNDDHGHGTHMAGIVAAASNNWGIIGAAPKATLVPVKVLDQHGAGRASDVINGLQWVYNNGIPLVNMSFGFPVDSTPLRQAIQSLNQSGIIMVASAGNRCAAAPMQDDGGGDDCKGGPAKVCNDERTSVMYPGAYPAVIAVAATNIDDDIANYSLEGNEVDVAAPGGEMVSGVKPDGRILSTNKGSGYGWGYGTSQAAAHVTGTLALVLQVDSEISFEEVIKLLNTTAENLGYPKEQQGAGRINAMEMIQALP